MCEIMGLNEKIVEHFVDQLMDSKAAADFLKEWATNELYGEGVGTSLIDYCKARLEDSKRSIVPEEVWVINEHRREHAGEVIAESESA